MNEEAQKIDNKVNKVKYVSKSKRVAVIAIVLLIFVPLAIWLTTLIYPFSNIDDKNGKKGNKYSPLNNPVVMKAIESLPIPKITLVQVTVVPTEKQDNGEVNNIVIEESQDNIDKTEWTTYKNSNLNFSLDYPADFKVEENSYGLGVSEISFISSTNTDPDVYPDIQILIYPTQIGKLIGQDFERLYMLEENTVQRMSSESTEPRLFTMVKKIQIAGYEAFEFRSTGDPPDENIDAEIGIYLSIDDSILIISTGEGDKPILDRMISSFKKL